MWQLIGMTAEAVGTLLIAFTVIRTHGIVSRERRIDKRVLQAIHWERMMAVVGVICLFIGYIFQVKSVNWY